MMQTQIGKLCGGGTQPIFCFSVRTNQIVLETLCGANACGGTTSVPCTVPCGRRKQATGLAATGVPLAYFNPPIAPNTAATSSIPTSACDAATFMAISRAKDKAVATSGLMATNPGCGHCILGCSMSGGDVQACIMTGCVRAPAGSMCALSTVMTVAQSPNPDVALTNVMSTDLKCGTCLFGCHNQTSSNLDSCLIGCVAPPGYALPTPQPRLLGCLAAHRIRKH